MPMQGPQAHSKSRAPAESMALRSPLSESMVSTWREPGETDRLTVGATVRPRSMAAALRMS